MSDDIRVKVAVIGSGLAGLTAAYLLTTASDAKTHFEVHLFEKVNATGSPRLEYPEMTRLFASCFIP